jgi:hypothetical protein
MPRVTKADLLAENERLRKRLEEVEARNARSRSPRRDAPSAAKTRRALNLVCQLERDAVIDEQRATIARQQQEIASLRRGEGPIGEVLLHNRNEIPGEETDWVIEHLSSQTTPVNQVLASLHRVAMAQKDILTWGGIPKFQADRMRPTIRIVH